jgi:uncharacterized protein (TIGR02145 family)
MKKFAILLAVAAMFLFACGDNSAGNGAGTGTKYKVTVLSAGTGESGNGNYAGGATVTIKAGTAPAGYQFKYWTTESDGVVFTNANSANTTFIMPANDVTVRAVFDQKEGGGDGSKYNVIILSAGKNPSADGSYAVGATVTISAGTPPDGQRFKKWTSADGVTLGDSTRATTAFVMPPKSVTLTAVFEPTSFIDIRDAKTYETVIIGGKTWMAQNLNYETVTGSWCYDDNASYCNQYGRLYDWNTAMDGSSSSTISPSGVKGVCPAGWHLPSRQEWGDLAIAAGGTDAYGVTGTAATKLKAKSSWNNNGNGTDDYGFTALAAGYRANTGAFSNVGLDGEWWTATQYNADNAFVRNMASSRSDVRETPRMKSSSGHGGSVRCVRND